MYRFEGFIIYWMCWGFRLPGKRSGIIVDANYRELFGAMHLGWVWFRNNYSNEEDIYRLQTMQPEYDLGFCFGSDFVFYASFCNCFCRDHQWKHRWNSTWCFPWKLKKTSTFLTSSLLPWMRIRGCLMLLYHQIAWVLRAVAATACRTVHNLVRFFVC